MLLLFAAALASSSTPTPLPQAKVEPLVQAHATVRIVSGATLHLGSVNSLEGQQLRTTRISTPDGVQPARLIEFE